MGTQNWSVSSMLTLYNSNGSIQAQQPGTETTQSITHDVAGTGRRVKPAPPLLATAYSFTHRYMNYPKGTSTVYYANGAKRSVCRGGQVMQSSLVDGDMRTSTGWWNMTSASTVDIQSVAITKALNQLRSNGGEREGVFEPGVAWRERNELGAMYRSTGERVLGARDALANFDFRSVKRFLSLPKDFDGMSGLSRKGEAEMRRKLKRVPGSFARKWLEYKLGWVPLLQDLYGGAEALAYRSEKHHWDINCHARASRRETSVLRHKNTGSYKRPALEVVSEQLLRSATVGFTVSVEDDLNHKLAMLGLNNPASLMYESAPLTFVADYFFDLGNWLSALGAPYGTKFRTGFITKYIEWLITNQDDGRDPVGNSWYGEGRTCMWERSVLTNFPVPLAPLAVNPKGLSPGKITTLASLVVARFLPSAGKGADFRSSWPRLTD